MADREKIAKAIMNECEKDGEPVTMEEALEMADMEIKAGTSRRYEKSEESEKKKRAPKPKKIDEEKKKIIEILAKALTDNGYNAIIANVDKEITFNDLSVNLIRHRKEK